MKEPSPTRKFGSSSLSPLRFDGCKPPQEGVKELFQSAPDRIEFNFGLEKAIWNLQSEQVDTRTKEATIEVADSHLCGQTVADPTLKEEVPASLQANDREWNEIQVSKLDSLIVTPCVYKWDFKKKDNLIYKSVLRDLRRFYLKRLYEFYPHIVRKRMKNVSTKTLLDAFESMLPTIVKSSNSRAFAEYLLQICGHGKNRKFDHNEEIRESVRIYESCMLNFSLKKKTSLLVSPEFRALINYSVENHFEEIWNQSGKQTVEAQDKYSKILMSLYNEAKLTEGQ